MNRIDANSMRGMAVAALVVAGIVTTLATGGGGNGEMAPPPPTSTGPTLAITANNGFAVSSALVIALGLGFDLGDITGGEVLATSVDPPDAILLGDLLSKPTAAVQIPEDCAVSGTRDVTADLADPNTLTVGDRVTAVFVECDDNEGWVISGTVDMTVAAYQGDVFTDVFLLALDTVMTGVQISEGQNSMTVDGDFRLTLDSLDFPVVSIRMAGSELRISYDAFAGTLSDFDQYLQSDGSVVPDVKRAEAAGRLESAVLGGSLDYETVVPIEAVGDNDPHAGVILVTGKDNSSVKIVIVDATSIVLEIDTNGDGVVDHYVDTSWAELSDENSSINSSNAPTIAREVIYGVTGFGSVTVTAGAQFHPLGPFGQILLTSVSGIFGPIDVGCAVSGSAGVSGWTATAGNYVAGDSVAADFNACMRGAEILDGQMSFLISDYAASAGGAYRVTGTVIESGLERLAGGLLFRGNGTFETSYDHLYTLPGQTLLSATASSFDVANGGISRQLGAASVTAEITAAQPFVRISRSSSGHITSAALDGSYYYESLQPDVFYFDDDPATGPVSGELKVTATDDSTLLIRAVNETFVRLEIDSDGDGVADSTIDTTWAALL